jgi:hypothetical protein
MGTSSKLSESPSSADAGSRSRCRVPCWEDVEGVLTRLAETGEALPGVLGASNQITSYHRGRRLMFDSTTSSRWIALDDIRECWKTFERLGRIRRQDVLDPGRCSAFMMAVFSQVPGVVEQTEDEHYLVLPA